MLQSLDGYYSDSPIETPAADAFARDQFSARVATVLDQMAYQSSSSVAALVGPWGSGKSSILNLLATHLHAASTVWRVRRFNPWLFSDIDSLLSNYFSELGAAMPEGVNGQTGRERLGDYARRFAPLGKIAGLFGVDAEGIVTSAGNLISAPKTLADQRNELAQALSAIDDRILIIMDDVDRLQPEELLIVLKLIRLIGELPNVHYLLAYDERTLLDVLMSTPIGHDSESRAAQYIDKMVQVRFDLPPLTDFQEERLFTTAFLKLIGSINGTLSDREFRRLGIFYQDVMQETLRIPRRMNKYLGQLSAFLTAEIAGELNVIDFCILTFIRTFHGTLYARIPQWKTYLLANGLTRLTLPGGRDSTEAKRERWARRFRLSGVSGEELDSTLRLLGSLFPELGDLLDDTRRGRVDASTAAIAKHVASAEYFDRYFQFEVPANEISDALVADALDHLLDGAPGGADVVEVITRLESEPVLVLEKIRLLVVTRQCKEPVAIMQLLSDRYESFDWRDRQLFSSSAKDLARYVAFDVLRRMPEGVRISQVRRIAESADLAFSLDLALTVKRSDVGPADWLDEYVEALDRRFRVHIDERFIDLEAITRDEFGLFTTWGQLVGGESTRTVARQKISAGLWNVRRYLAHLTGTSYLLGVPDPPPRLSGLDTDWIEFFIGVDFAISALGVQLDDLGATPNLHDVQNPTNEDRERYALGVLKDLRDRTASNARQSDGTA